MDKYQLANRMSNNESYDAIKFALKGDIVLKDTQCVDVAKALLVEKCLITADTGLGKTYIASALIKLILGRLSREPVGKFLFVCKLDQRYETTQKILESTGLSCMFLDASSSTIDKIRGGLLEDVDVIMITINCFSKAPILNELLRYRNRIDGVIFDEMHEYVNYKNSLNGEAIFMLAKNLRYVYGLTATPENSREGQMEDILRCINYEEFPNEKDITKALIGKTDNYVLRASIINRNREGGNREAVCLRVKPTQYQRENPDDLPFRVLLKGPSGKPQLNVLFRTIKDNMRKNQRGLIYANLKVIQNAVLEEAKRQGVRAVLVNGEVTGKDRQKALNDFMNGDYDIIVTNITTSIKIDSDYVVFYELSSDIKQTIGRTERGFDSKELYIYYVITVGTPEEQSYNEIYRKARRAELKAGKDYSEVPKFFR